MRPVASPSASAAAAQAAVLSVKSVKIKVADSPPATDTNVVLVAVKGKKAESVLVAPAEPARDTAAALAGEAAAELQRAATLADEVTRPVSETQADDTSVPALEQPAEASVVETKPVEEPVVAQPVVELTVAEQPVVEQTVVEQPVVAAPTAEAASNETSSSSPSTSSASVTSAAKNKSSVQVKPVGHAVKRRNYEALNVQLAAVEKQLAKTSDKPSSLSDIVQRLNSLMAKFERLIELLYDRSSSRPEFSSGNDIRQLAKFARTSQKVLQKLPATTEKEAEDSLVEVSQKLSRTVRLLQSKNEAATLSRLSENSPSLAAATRAYNRRDEAKGVGLSLSLLA
jgi:hypothetical protein